MKCRVLRVITIICIIFILCACSEDINQNSTHKIIQNEDGRLSLEVPEYWKISTYPLNAEAQISVSMESEEKYVILINENKRAFEDDIKLKDYYNVVMKNICAGMESCEFGDPIDTNINGNEAILVEINGTVTDIDVVYWLMVVDSKNSFTQVVGWTVFGRYEQNKQEILSVLKSFKNEQTESILTNRKVEQTRSKKTVNVTSKDRRMTITLPVDWNKSDIELNEKADIAVSLRENDMFVVVASNKKDAFNDDITLTNYYNAIVANVLKSMQAYEFCEPIDTELNGKKAILVGIKGTIDKVEIAYWIYAVESEDSYINISGWTLYTKVEENRDLVLSIMESFVLDE